MPWCDRERERRHRQGEKGLMVRKQGRFYLCDKVW